MVSATEESRALPLDWINISFLAAVHIMTIVIAPWYFLRNPLPWAYGLAIFAGMYLMCGTAMTVGYHRYFSHGAFKCARWLAAWFLIWSAASFQNFCLKWVFDHRLHHRFVDKDRDPYNAKKGFWWSHWGWVFHQTPERDYTDPIVRDLANDPLIKFQKKFYIPIGTVFGFGMPILLGWLAGDAFAGFLIGGCVRLFAQYHSTFFVNSLAHYPHIFSSQPYSTINTSQDSPIVAILTFGEGYHNFHHFTPKDFRNAIQWFQFDPGKWMIWSLSKIGVTWDLYKTRPDIIKAALESPQSNNPVLQ